MGTLWDAKRSFIRVALRDVETEANIGLHKWEQHPERPTRLIVNVEMFAHTDGQARETAATIIDYDSVHAAIKTWPGRPHTGLLETLAEELVALCLANVRVEACRVSVMKPDIFNDAAAAGVELYRVRTP